jgi:two-component system sensor histidine kinase QseC
LHVLADVLAHERRFTADAAHELRTPLAALRAQWDVVRRAAPGSARTQAEDRLAAGFERMERLVAQLLMLSRVEGVRPGTEALAKEQEVNWREIVEEAVADCLPLAGRRFVEIECDWPRDDRRALPLFGHAPLLIVMLRNLLDNAVRYATSHSTVTLAFTETTLTIENECAPIAAKQLERLGEPFHRIEGHSEPGSGLGISIARRIAALHGLAITLGPRDDGTGLRASVTFASRGTDVP